MNSFILKNKAIFSLLLGFCISSLFKKNNLYNGTYFIAIFSISPLIYIVKNSKNLKSAALYGWLFGFGYFMSVTWMANALLVYDEFKYLFPFVVLIGPTFLGLIFALNCLCYKFITKYNFIENKLSPTTSFAIIWTTFEFVRMFLFTGLPWNLLAHSISFSTPLMQFASIFGELGLSFLLCKIGGAFYFLLNSENKKFAKELFVSLLIISSLYIFGQKRLENNKTVFLDKTVKIIQPCLEQIEKWDTNYLKNTIDKNINLSALNEGKNDENPDFIIWPEAAVPTYYEYVKDYLIYHNFLNNSILLTGGISSEGDKIYSSFYAINKLGEVEFEYFKSHLVPFGEYMPLEGIIPFDKISPGKGGYSKGKGNQIYEIRGIKIKPLICYEAIFSIENVTKNTKAEVIINITNDAWYGDSDGPHQHFNIVRFRAIENGLPVLRSANNGISSVIDSVGRVVEYKNLNEVGYIYSRIPAKLNKETIYSKLFFR